MKTELVRVNTPSAGLVRVPAGTIERRIFAMRGHTVMLDRDLAKLYRVTTKASIRQSNGTAIGSHPTLCSS